MRSGTLTLVTDSCLDHVFLVAAAMRGIARDCGLDELNAAQVELAVVEAVNNAIEHAYAGHPGHRVEVHVAVAGGRLTVEVADTGAGMQWDVVRASALARAEADPLAEGGRGLLIITEVMDEVGYRRDGARNVLRLTKRIGDGALG